MATKIKLIEPGAVTGNIIPDGGITTGKLANDAVTTIKISDANITHAKLHTSMDLTGKTVTVATAAGSTNTTAAASTAFVQQELTTLIGGAPSTLNDLNELAAAINDDSNYNSTLTTALATKLPLAGGTLTGALTSNSLIKTTGDLEIASTQPRIMLDRSNGAYTWNIYNGSGSGNFPQSTFNIANNGGTAVITALDSGNVGIGVTNPGQVLEIHNSDTSDYTDFALRGTGHKYVIGVGNDSVATVNDKWYLYDNDNTAFRMVVDTSGNVGIGTTSPGALLDLETAGNTLDGSYYSTMTINNTGSSTYSGVRFDRSGAARWRVGLMPDDKFQIAKLYNTVDDTAFVINSNGNVGIGTTSPGSPLTISNLDNGTSFSSNRILQLIGTSTTDGSRVSLAFSGNTNIGNGLAIIEAVNDDQSAGHTSLHMHTYNGSWNTENLVLKGGKVGIGTSNPTGKLHVSGGRAGIISTDSSWGQFRVGNTSDAEVGIAYVTGATESDFLNDGDPACGYKVIMGINPYSAGTRNFGIGNDTILNYHTIWTEAGHQEPRVDNTYDLGSSTKGFRNVYLSSDLSVGGNVTKPIQTTTDSGTRMYTGLATGSHYYSTGFLILDTNIPDPGQSTGANMFSIHINGFSYNDVNGGIIDLKIGAYSGEGYFHNASYTGSNIPDKWVNNVRFARKTATNTVSIILGDSGTAQPVEVAATLFIQGFGNTSTAYAQGWDWKVSSTTTGYTSLDKVNEKSTKRPSFSASYGGFSVSTGWQLISDSMNQVHDGPDDDYNPSNGRFTPQLPGWYQFNFGGWATYNSSNGYERYATAFAKNGSLQYLAGGNYSNADSPLAGASQRIYLNGSTDYVELRAYSSVATNWGGSSHHVWWDGYWTGS